MNRDSEMRCFCNKRSRRKPGSLNMQELLKGTDLYNERNSMKCKAGRERERERGMGAGIERCGITEQGEGQTRITGGGRGGEVVIQALAIPHPTVLPQLFTLIPLSFSSLTLTCSFSGNVRPFFPLFTLPLCLPLCLSASLPVCASFCCYAVDASKRCN